MLELFLNPWSMAAGAGLVSAPILIHLINRMRFRRVKWAAMEFLLKAQKRMKRKLIIEQLLLLFLRCLLVALAGLLVGRFLGFSPGAGRDTKATAHVVLLDDTPSTEDFWRGDDGQITNCFKQAGLQLTGQIVPAAAQATTPQTLEVLRLSELGAPRAFGRVSSGSAKEVESYLGALRPSTVRVGLPDALRKARETLDATPGADTARVLHVLSDFRSVDWAQDGIAIQEAVRTLTADGTKVHFVDVAHPYRKEEKKTPLFHDNIGIVELRPKARVVAKDQPLEFVLRVKNFGTTELKDVRCSILVNGDENRGLSLFFPTLPPNQDKAVPFQLQFSQVAGPDKPLERFSLVTAKLELAEPGGITADNVRHAVVEVRERLSVLVVEGRDGKALPLDEQKKADGFYLRRLFTESIGGLNWVSGTVKDLETQDLRQYTSVYLLNVPTLSDAAVKNLEGYAAEGGGVGLFLGDLVRPLDYNAKLYNDAKGLLPVPLPDKPTDPLTDEQKLARVLLFSKRMLLRDPSVKSHPAVVNLYTDERGNPIKDADLEKFFNFVAFDQYWPVLRIGKWREDKSVQELYTLPNDRPIANYQARAEEVIQALPLDEPKFAKHAEHLKKLKQDIHVIAAGSEPLARLAQLLDRLLADQINEGDPNEAPTREFWANPEVAELRAKAVRLRDDTKFGDPLYLARQFGRGRVTVLLTSPGEGWNDWPSGPGRASWVAVMAELQKYLAGGGSDENPATGTPISMSFDGARYKPDGKATLLTFDPAKDKAALPGESAVKPFDLGEVKLVAKGDRLEMAFPDSARPGAYVFEFTQLKGPNAGPADPAEKPEYAAVAANVDAAREGDLRRVPRDDVALLAPNVPMHSPDDASWTDALKEKKTDLSSSRWLYLFILLVLVAEQALAVKLSFHTRPDELQTFAPTAARAFAHGAASSVTGVAAPPPPAEPAAAS